MSGADNINETATAVLVAAYTVTANDFVVLFDPTAGYAITLPAASAALKGREYRLVQTVSNAGQVTIKSAGGTVNNAAAGTGITLTASKLGVLTAVCDGTNWWLGGGSAVLS